MRNKWVLKKSSSSSLEFFLFWKYLYSVSIILFKTNNDYEITDAKTSMF